MLRDVYLPILPLPRTEKRISYSCAACPERSQYLNDQHSSAQRPGPSIIPSQVPLQTPLQLSFSTPLQSILDS